jgi:hypothetical protein
VGSSGSELAQKRALIQWVVEKLQQLSAAHPPDTPMMKLAKLLPEPEGGAVSTICRDVFNARHRELQALCCDPAFALPGTVDEAVADGMLVKIPGKPAYYSANEYGKQEPATVGIDALVAAGSHYRGQDDEETGEPRFFAILPTTSTQSTGKGAQTVKAVQMSEVRYQRGQNGHTGPHTGSSPQQPTSKPRG